MAQGKIFLNIKSAAKYYDPTAAGALKGGQVPGTGSPPGPATNPVLPDGTNAIQVGGCLDSAGNPHTIEVYQAVTCEDDGTGTGNTKEYCRLILMSDRFAKPTCW